MHTENFYKLLRIACDSGESFAKITDEEWLAIYDEATRQFMLGVVYSALCKLPQDMQPPMEIMFQWASEFENIKGLNKLLNSEASRYTKIFADVGRKTVILKGPANARLYPDPFSRQLGDIDIWVEGGQKSVLHALQELGLWEKGFNAGHHVLFNDKKSNVAIEVHFKPSSGNWNPFSRRRLLKFLDAEIANLTLVPEGFYVPTMRFALAMQLSHIQRHFINDGIGFRQIMDYYLLLRNSTENDRNEITKYLKSFGLQHISGAMMWLLQKVFGLDRNLMLCEPDEFRGKWLLREVMDGGNFGRSSADEKRNFVIRWLHRRIFIFHRMKFDFWEVLWRAINYWIQFVKDIPLRIKLRKLSIKNEQR